jgi:thiol:disulfide interchange protein DsbD
MPEPKPMKTLRLLASAALALIGCNAQAEPQAGPVAADHIVVELVAADTAVAPGADALLGLRLEHEEHWHTYWVNPGDSGLATKVTWLAPADETGTISWPTPQRLPFGPLVNFGYEGHMVLPISVRVPADARPGDTVDYAVQASWLVCKEECIPGKAELAVSVPVAASPGLADPRWQHLFAAAAATTPAPAVGMTAQLMDDGTHVDIRIEGLGDVVPAAIEVFPLVPQVIANAPGAVTADGPSRHVVRTLRSDAWNGLPASVPVVVVDRSGSAPRYLALDAVAVTAADTAAPSAAGAPASVDGAGNIGLALAVLFAFTGGMLLNLMPCVFPVLSLKAMGMVGSHGELAQARRHGWFYLAGCVLSFVALAGLLLALRAGGEQLGWGFQLQTPWVVALLALVMLAMGLSLSGWFEIGGGFMNVGQSLTEGHGDRSAFFTGVLACVVASPCTAPFMGPALGWAITQPAVAALAVFAALGAGLAAPLVLVSMVPALAQRMPRPGAWMERFRQLMAFPMYLTAVWLFWVLGRQTGADGMALALVAAVALAFALWLSRLPSRKLGMPAALAMAALAVWAVVAVERQPAPAAADASATHAAWTPERLAELRARGEPVLVNMTAAWCITCLANERVALSSDAFASALDQLGVAYLKGDWTDHDAAITDYLSQFGRSGVPLYVLYPRGGGAPEVLPQLLTPDLVDAALRRAAAGGSATVAAAAPVAATVR